MPSKDPTERTPPTRRRSWIAQILANTQVKVAYRS